MVAQQAAELCHHRWVGFELVGHNPLGQHVENGTAIGADPAILDIEKGMQDEAGRWIEIDHATVPVAIFDEPTGLGQPIIDSDIAMRRRGRRLVRYQGIGDRRSPDAVDELADRCKDALARRDFAGLSEQVLGEVGQQVGEEIARPSREDTKEARRDGPEKKRIAGFAH
jgi:hypothetical protein